MRLRGRLNRGSLMLPPWATTAASIHGGCSSGGAQPDGQPDASPPDTSQPEGAEADAADVDVVDDFAGEEEEAVGL